MPSTTPDSRTISATSSVMSVTWRPPVVWKCRSAWKTFITWDPNEYPRAFGPVAQRLEQGTHNSLVPGSNPGGPFKNQGAKPKPAWFRVPAMPGMPRLLKWCRPRCNPDPVEFRARLAAGCDTAGDSRAMIAAIDARLGIE